MNEWIYGIHTIRALLQDDPQSFINVYVVKGRLNIRLQLLIQELSQNDLFVQYRERYWLNNKVQNSVHQGIVAEVFYKKHNFQEKDMPQLLMQYDTPLLLVLDGITDPRNLGACLRCAVAFGVNMVLVSRHRSSRLNSTVRKVASGMADKVTFIRVTNLVHTLMLLKQFGVRIIGTVLEAKKSIFQTSLVGRLAVVIGSESSGIRFLTRRSCDELITIPMQNESASLNVSVAAGVFLFEAIRQRSKN